MVGRVDFWLQMSEEPPQGGEDPGRHWGVVRAWAPGGATDSPPHLVEAAAVPGEAPQLALQVDNAGFPPDHFDPHLIILLLQLADLLPVLVLLD